MLAKSEYDGYGEVEMLDKSTAERKLQYSSSKNGNEVVSDIMKLLSQEYGDDYAYGNIRDSWGLRVDDYDYGIGDTMFNSHELYQDPLYDFDDNLVFPKGEGIYEGYYDGGELDGTCSVGIEGVDGDSAERSKGVAKAFELSKGYLGKYLFVISGSYSYGGNDLGESVIRNAVVRRKYIINSDGTYTDWNT